MKQEITKTQIKELSEEALERYREWVNARGYWGYAFISDYLMNVGVMIEFLGEHDKYMCLDLGNIHVWCNAKNMSFVNTGSDGSNVFNKELCDALWEAVKEVLSSP